LKGSIENKHIIIIIIISSAGFFTDQELLVAAFFKTKAVNIVICIDFRRQCLENETKHLADKESRGPVA